MTRSSQPALKVGIAGLGTVGRGVVRVLQDNAQFLTHRCGRPLEIAAVSAQSRDKDRGVDLSAYRWVDDARAMADDPELDLVVELIGGSEGIARELVEKAIAAGKDVVTANKALMAHHGSALASAADEAGVALNYEGAVAGGIPVIKALREGLAGNRIKRVFGILNGTCNYILSTMETTGKDFAVVLKEAQDKGYAEADPTFDVGGIDTAHKLAILAGLAFGTTVDYDKVFVEGIEHISADDIRFTRELGYRIKLLGVAERSKGRITARIHPCLLPLETPMSDVMGVMNAVRVEADPVSHIFLEGPGAGEGPTASAVVADIADIARGQRTPVFMTRPDDLADTPVMDIDDHVCAHYVRLAVIDKPGVMASITRILAEAEISLESILQRGRAPGEAVPIVMRMHDAREGAMREAIDRIMALDAVVGTPCRLRIETL